MIHPYNIFNIIPSTDLFKKKKIKKQSFQWYLLYCRFGTDFNYLYIYKYNVYTAHIRNEVLELNAVAPGRWETNEYFPCTVFFFFYPIYSYFCFCWRRLLLYRRKSYYIHILHGYTIFISMYDMSYAWIYQCWIIL